MDGNHGELYPKSHEFSSFGVPYIGATDFYSGNIDFKNCKYLPIQRAKKFKKGIAKSGDVLFAHNATVGPVALVETELDFIIISTTATYYRCNKDVIDNFYLASYFRSEIFIKQFSSVMSQSTRNQVPILAQRKFLLVLPPVKEQTAIANALSDVDALISELEKLIAKKQAIKTATMQQLLTGRTRLPQFALREDGTPTNSSGTNLDAGTGGPKGEGQDGLRKSTKQSELGEIPEDWEVELLRSVCDSFKTGKLDANAMKPDGEYRFYTCAKEYYYIDRYAFDEEALMVSGNGANVGYVHYYKGKFNAYQRTYVLSNFIADVIYLKIYLERKLAERIRVEVNAGNTPYITMDTLTDMPIVLPPKEEQIAIATILSDMDTEIQALEQRLSKTRQIKQGMMQELLTGRTRLPFEKEQ